MTGNEPLVSVVMPVYNGERFIGQAIQSVLEQTYKNWELLVVNDGSTDGTSKIIGKFMDSRIIVLNQIHSERSAARNHALRKARGEFICFLDADDLYLACKLELQVNYLVENPQYDGVCSFICRIDENGRLIRFSVRGRAGPVSLQKELIKTRFSLITLMLTKEMITRVGKFDENINASEDWLFTVNILANGASIYKMSRSLAKYRYVKGTVTSDCQYMFDSQVSLITYQFSEMVPGFNQSKTFGASLMET